MITKKSYGGYMVALSKLVSGYRVFKATTYEEHKDVITHLLRMGAKPTSLVITSCSLRISADQIFGCSPGDLYVIRNVGGFVPPYEEKGMHGTLAAIEYAIKVLKVENVMIVGHAHCEGVRELMKLDEHITEHNRDPMKAWLSIAVRARDEVRKQMAGSSEQEQLRACEKEVVLVSLLNLLEYPWIKELVEQGKLDIYGWYFNIEKGELLAFNPQSKFFELVE